MPGVTGTALYVKFGSTVMSSDFRSFSQDEKVDLKEDTAGADANKTWLALTKDGGAKFSGVWQTGTATGSGSSIWAAVAVGGTGVLEWGEEGTASGKNKHTVNAIVESREKETPYDDIIVISAEWHFSGAVSDTSY